MLYPSPFLGLENSQLLFPHVISLPSFLSSLSGIIVFLLFLFLMEFSNSFSISSLLLYPSSLSSVIFSILLPLKSFILPSALSCYWCSLVHSSIHSLNFWAQNLLVFKNNFNLFGKELFLFMFFPEFTGFFCSLLNFLIKDTVNSLSLRSYYPGPLYSLVENYHFLLVIVFFFF